jgi:hypothetical protein
MIEPVKVTPLPLSKIRITAIIREIASDSARWSINVAAADLHATRHLVNKRQVERCLLDGYVIEEYATLDEHDNWRCSVGRVCGGVHVNIEVAVERSPALPKLFVIAIKGEQISTEDIGGEL